MLAMIWGGMRFLQGPDLRHVSHLLIGVSRRKDRMRRNKKMETKSEKGKVAIRFKVILVHL